MPAALPFESIAARSRGLSPADVAVFGEIYVQLKPRAHQLLSAHRNETLNTTGLVHEAFLKLLQHAGSVADRRHLYRLTVLAMRQILLDRVRVKDARRHGGDLNRVTLTGLDISDPVQPFDIVLFDGTLEQLRLVDARKAEVFELARAGRARDEGNRDLAGDRRDHRASRFPRRVYADAALVAGWLTAQGAT